MEELLMMLARNLVSKPDSVKIEVNDSAEDGMIHYHLYVDPSDMGRIIGKQGRVAKAIRQILYAVIFPFIFSVFIIFNCAPLNQIL